MDSFSVFQHDEMVHADVKHELMELIAIMQRIDWLDEVIYGDMTIIFMQWNCIANGLDAIACTL